MTTDNQDYLKTIALYDFMPKYFHGRIKRIKNKPLPIISRDFEYMGKPLNLQITPALIKLKDGTKKAFYLSLQEELIELVLIRFAIEGREKLFDKDKKFLKVKFTLYKLWKELKDFKHQRNYSKIKKSLGILEKTTLSIKHKDSKLFYTFNMFKAIGNNEKEHFVIFNEILSKSILNNTHSLFMYRVEE